MESYKRPMAILGDLELSYEDLKGRKLTEVWQTSNIYNKNDIYIYVYVSTHTHSEAKKTIKIYKADQLHWPSRLCQEEREGRATV